VVIANPIKKTKRKNKAQKQNAKTKRKNKALHPPFP